MTDFEGVISIITCESFYEIEQHWQSIDLIELSKSKIPIDSKINGLYALWHPQFGIIYIGKGKLIINRLKSHYKATQGKEKAPAWKQFFERINTDIKIYWYRVDNPNQLIAEQSREALERLLQIKYKPLFDLIYPKGNRKMVINFEVILKEQYCDFSWEWVKKSPGNT